MTEVEHGILGKATHYPKQYSPEILYPIARAEGRRQFCNHSWLGYDMWHAYELSWLGRGYIPQVALARLVVPADSPYLIESKSLKLYLNSLNFSCFDGQDALTAVLQKDLSACVQADVCVQLLALDAVYGIDKLSGVCIDDALDEVGYEQDADVNVHHLMRQLDSTVGEQVYFLHSHLLRSNCPVTNQPDWGSVALMLKTEQEVNYGDVLRYILSYRHHNGFHEQCVERIYDDLQSVYKPTQLLVQAQYTRRGGLDINPVRASDEKLLNYNHLRLSRQ